MLDDTGRSLDNVLTKFGIHITKQIGGLELSNQSFGDEKGEEMSIDRLWRQEFVG